MTAPALDLSAGDVPAREAAVCSHGVSGYCWDDALPEERQAVEFIHSHAFNYALPRGRELAEAYAVWCVQRAWFPGVVVVEGSHSLDFPKFLQETSAV